MNIVEYNEIKNLMARKILLRNQAVSPKKKYTMSMTVLHKDITPLPKENKGNIF